MAIDSQGLTTDWNGYAYADFELQIRKQLQGRQSWGRAAQESRRALKQVLEVITT